MTNSIRDRITHICNLDPDKVHVDLDSQYDLFKVIEDPATGEVLGLGSNDGERFEDVFEPLPNCDDGWKYLGPIFYYLGLEWRDLYQ